VTRDESLTQEELRELREGNDQFCERLAQDLGLRRRSKNPLDRLLLDLAYHNEISARVEISDLAARYGGNGPSRRAAASARGRRNQRTASRSSVLRTWNTLHMELGRAPTIAEIGARATVATKDGRDKPLSHSTIRRCLKELQLLT
jgi:hypothetical protein